MPHSDLHKKKNAKNYMVLGAIVAWIALIWIITMIKISNG
jgi:hypothetical protein